MSAEERHAAHPETFRIPSRCDREHLVPGDAAKLLFDIETREAGRVVDRGVDRMWVVVKARLGGGVYLGMLDNDPGRADPGSLREGAEIRFRPEHVADIARPPREYIVAKYGTGFFDA